MEELIDVLDEFGNKTGIIKTKSEIKRDGDYHRAISVLILNGDKILLQKRCSKKKIYPNLWSIFVKGHVKSGENSIEASIREIKEEVGLTINEKQLKYLYTIKEEKKNDNYIENIFNDIYLLKKRFNLKDITIQEEEVSEVKLMNVNEVLNLIKNSKDFVPNEEDYNKIFKCINII